MGTADEALDAAVILLADKMIGAQLGNRKNPFAEFSSYAPFKLTSLAYADEVTAVLALTSRMKKMKLTAEISRAVASCEKLANGVNTALSRLSKPQLAYQKSLATRDALLPDWTKSLNRLKKHAAAAWFDDSSTYKAVFAPPERVQAPVHARPKKAAVAAAAAPGVAKPAT